MTDDADTPAEGYTRATLPVIGSGTSMEDARRPDLPDGVAVWALVSDDDTTMTVDFPTPVAHADAPDVWEPGWHIGEDGQLRDAVGELV